MYLPAKNHSSAARPCRRHLLEQGNFKKTPSRIKTERNEILTLIQTGWLDVLACILDVPWRAYEEIQCQSMRRPCDGDEMTLAQTHPDTWDSIVSPLPRRAHQTNLYATPKTMKTMEPQIRHITRVNWTNYRNYSDQWLLGRASKNKKAFFD